MALCTGFGDLSGAVAVVTGGNGGIGLGMALGLASAGCKIVIAARNADKSAVALREIEDMGVDALAVTTDVKLEDEVDQLLEKTIKRFGQVDILVNNAGMNLRKSPEDYLPEEWDLVMDTNLRSAFLCSKAFFPSMKMVRRGKIINIGSMFSIFGGDVVPAYAASKGGIVQLTKSLAVAWAPHNIQVNAVLPGWITTDLTEPIATQFPDWHQDITSRIPAGRWGVPSDLAGVALFLASGASNYITGAVLTVDGGYSVK